MYKALVRPALYQLPAEPAHYFAANNLNWLSSLAPTRSIIKSLFSFENQKLNTNVFGLDFPNPIGLAAGFDKDARWIEALELLGFGFIEIGTLTPKSQPGNPKPRLFRLEKDQALINRMGFNNEGVDAAVERIIATNRKTPLGGNIGKNKVTANADAVSDYTYCFKALYPHVDYFVVNVSSPNTPGLRELQGKEELKKIFDALFEIRTTQSIERPILLKIAPDLSDPQTEDIVALVKEIGIDGLVVSNTTLNRKGLKSKSALAEQMGGLSGKPVRHRSTELIKAVKDLSSGTIPMIGVGGIHSPEDALEKLDAGASLVQLYTGFIYEGPGLIKSIKKAIVNAS